MEDGFEGVHEAGEAVGDDAGEVGGEVVEGEGGVEAAPSGGPLLQFVVGAEGVADLIGTEGEPTGEVAAPVGGALQVEADFDATGLADGPDLVVQAGLAEMELEGGEEDAGDGAREGAVPVGEDVGADLIEEDADGEVLRGH